MKKKPVLVLDEQELAQAHLAMAMGGAEIMETADLAPAPRQPQPAMLLGLAPMGRDEPEDEAWRYPPQALASDDDAAAFAGSAADEEPLDADEYPHAGSFAGAQEDDEEAVEEPDEAPAPLPAYNLDHLLGAARSRPAVSAADELDDDDDDDVPSIAEQLQRMREKAIRLPQAAPVAPPASVVQAAPAPAPAPEPAPEPAEPPAPPRLSTIERLEIDDWAQITPPRAIVPPPVAEERAPAAPPAFAPPASAMPAPPPAAVPASHADEPDDAFEDEWGDWPEDESEAVAAANKPMPAPPVAPAPPPAPAAPARLSADLDALAQPLAGRPSTSALRARIRDKQASHQPAASPSLLARLVRWLQGLLGR